MADGGGHLPASPQPKARLESTKSILSTTSLPSSVVVVLLCGFGAWSSEARLLLALEYNVQRSSDFPTRSFKPPHQLVSPALVILAVQTRPRSSPSRRTNAVAISPPPPVACLVGGMLLALLIFALLAVWSLLPQMVRTGW